MANIEEYLHSLKIGEAQRYENLTVFPLIATSIHAPDYLTLDEALKQSLLEVREVDEAGRVNEVLLLNKSGQMILLLDGEILTGAKQNRVLNVSILVAAHAAQKIPVSCVEQGRWRHVADKFTASRDFSYANLRSQKSAQVSESLYARGNFSADQGAIWAEVERKQRTMGVHSPTGALNEVYESQLEKIEEFRSAFSVAEEQVGSIVFLKDKFICLDLFDSPETFRKLNQKLIESYALDALEKTQTKKKMPENEHAAQLLAELAAAVAVAKRYPSAALGEDLRIQTENLNGSCLTLDGKIIHLAAFPAVKKIRLRRVDKR